MNYDHGMRVIVVLMMMVSSVARADSKADVEALLKKHLATIQADDWEAFDATFRKDGYYFFPSTGAVHLIEQFHGTHAVGVTQKIERMTVAADDTTKVAWFNVEFTAKYQLAMYSEGPPPWFNDRIRMVGIAIDDGGWKLAAATYGQSFADKYLYEEVSQIEQEATVVKGERTSAEYAQRWFTKGLVAAMAPGALAVNGTAEGEWAIGRNVPKLAATWDKLKLWPIRIVGRTWKSYPIALVVADVGMPVKKGAGGVAAVDGAVRLRMFSVAVPDGKAWKWTTLSFTGWFDDDSGPHGPGQHGRPSRP